MGLINIHIYSGTYSRTETEYERIIWKIPLVWYSLSEASQVPSCLKKLRIPCQIYQKKRSIL